LSQIRDRDPDFPLPTETQGDGKKKDSGRQVLAQRGDAFRSQAQGGPVCGKGLGSKPGWRVGAPIVDLWVDDG